MNVHKKFQRRYTIANDDISFDVENPMDSILTNENLIHSINVTNSSTSNTSSISNSSNASNASGDYLLRKGILLDVASEPFLPRQWRIKDEDVTELPEIYPRLSSPLIIRDSEVSKIGDSLFDFLRFNSVRSVYDSQRARIFCYTNRASFVVQFWRRSVPVGAANSTSTEAGAETQCPPSTREEIVLEIQRRQGCSYAMHKIRTALKKSIAPRPSVSFGTPRCSVGSSSSCSSNRSPSMICYERLLLKHQNRPFKRPNVEEMESIAARKRATRWSEFLHGNHAATALRRASIGSTATPAPNHAPRMPPQRKSNSSIDSLIDGSIFVAAATSDPSVLDNDEATESCVPAMVE